MKRVYALGLMLVVFLALGVGSVYAPTGEANLGLPILGTVGLPALSAPSLYSGAISVLYADGTSVVLESTQNIPLSLCSVSSCITVMATLRETSAGVYTYSFTPPTTLTGTITIYVPANSLGDDNGRVFPSVSTSIGTYVYAPSSSSSSSAPPAASVPPAAGTPVQPALTRDAVNTTPTPATQASPIEPLLVVLSVLSVAGTVLASSKRRAH